VRKSFLSDGLLGCGSGFISDIGKRATLIYSRSKMKLKAAFGLSEARRGLWTRVSDLKRGTGVNGWK
jgi:hypothetical protein